jgi:hypothetical protein
MQIGWQNTENGDHGVGFHCERDFESVGGPNSSNDILASVDCTWYFPIPLQRILLVTVYYAK